MRKKLARRRDTLDEKNLPRGRKGETELNHRTQVLSRRKAASATRFVIARQVGTALLFVIPVRILSGLSLPIIGIVFLPLIVWNLVVALVNYLRSRPTGDRLTWAGIFLLAWVLFWALSLEPNPTQSYFLIFGPAVIVAGWLSHVIAKQFAYWMSVNVRLEKDVVLRWQEYWGYLFKPVNPDECPEIESYRVGFLSLGGAYAVGFAALYMTERSPYHALSGLAGLGAFLVSCLLFWALWSTSGQVPWMSPAKVARVTWQGLTTWYCYNSHQTTAPGVFQFPTIRFRRMVNRYAASWVTLFLLALSVAQMEAGPFNEFVRERARTFAAHLPIGPKFNAVRVQLGLTPNERAWFSQLPPQGREPYLRQVFERGHGLGGELATRTNVLIAQGIGFFVGLTLLPVGLLAVVFATSTGRLLVAYFDALEARNAYEVKPGYWPWDNQFSRILNSSNPLERDHLLIGWDFHKDIPIYLYLKLLWMHAHFLGDTGSNKTSIGIAPLMTQLIARADSSILILDLKGDKGLFQCARDEAERAGLPFKFFTNVKGRASHVFNPLQQSHSHTLTASQRSQAILQALALEYGEGYGASFYSAKNEIVLKTYLDHYKSISTFRELYDYVKVQHAYKAIGGVEQDWKDARHLAILLDKLASVYPLNLDAGHLSQKPGAFKNQIDMPSLIKEKQVVYFYLSAPLEPTTVSPIARLAMFNLLSAAAQAEGSGNRVYVFIDEFQRIVTENIRLFLEQARSMKLHFILANQTMSQLKGNTLDLRDTIESCTAYKRTFKASDLTSMLHLEEASGEALYHELQWQVQIPPGLNPTADVSYGDEVERVASVKETSGPRLQRNTIIELSAASWLSLVRFTEGSGFTQYSGYYTQVISGYHIPASLYEQRLARPWPEVDENTVKVEVTEDEPVRGLTDEPGIFRMPGAGRSVADRLDEEDDPEDPT